jgi:hypothetical protein
MLIKSKCCKFDIPVDPTVAHYECSEERHINFAEFQFGQKQLSPKWAIKHCYDIALSLFLQTAVIVPNICQIRSGVVQGANPSTDIECR